LQIGHFASEARRAIAALASQRLGEGLHLNVGGTDAALRLPFWAGVGPIMIGTKLMNYVLRIVWASMVVLALGACSAQPLKTTLPETMKVSNVPVASKNRPKTLSSDILSDIAMERVTGRRPVEWNVASAPRQKRTN
jgi:hypothetical protein